jgi:hypothetical protein
LHRAGKDRDLRRQLEEGGRRARTHPGQGPDVSDTHERIEGMKGCPGCTEYRGDNGVWRPYGPHVEGCKMWESEAVERMRTSEALERSTDEERAAIADGCKAHGCGHPLQPGDEDAWRQYHEIALASLQRSNAAAKRDMRNLGQS